jgi:hypothetical protein
MPQLIKGPPDSDDFVPKNLTVYFLPEFHRKLHKQTLRLLLGFLFAPFDPSRFLGQWESKSSFAR